MITFKKTSERMFVLSSKTIQKGDSVLAVGEGYPHWNNFPNLCTLVYDNGEDIGINNSVRVKNSAFRKILMEIKFKKGISVDIASIFQNFEYARQSTDYTERLKEKLEKEVELNHRLENLLKISRKEVEKSDFLIKALEKKLKNNEEKLLSSKRLLEEERDRVKMKLGSFVVSNEIMQKIIKMLPDPNKTGRGQITSEDLLELQRIGKDCLSNYLDYITIKSFSSTNGNIDAIIFQFRDSKKTIRIDLKKEVVVLAYGVNIEVSTYYWDIRNSGMNIIGDEDWRHIITFSEAGDKFFAELRADGLIA